MVFSRTWIRGLSKEILHFNLRYTVVLLRECQWILFMFIQAMCLWCTAKTKSPIICNQKACIIPNYTPLSDILSSLRLRIRRGYCPSMTNFTPNKRNIWGSAVHICKDFFFMNWTILLYVFLLFGVLFKCLCFWEALNLSECIYLQALYGRNVADRAKNTNYKQSCIGKTLSDY